jgi:thiamine transporter ThiT
MFIIKKIIRITGMTIQGVVIGVFLNFSWHFFLASVIGWGDSAPDWYFNIQETVFVFIFLIGVVGWIIFNLRLKRKPWPTQLAGYRKRLLERFEIKSHGFS